jgi:hypothetical protein
MSLKRIEIFKKASNHFEEASKIARTPKQPINKTNVVKSEKEPNICMGPPRRNLKDQPKIIKKKLPKHQINEVNRKKNPKNVCLVP